MRTIVLLMSMILSNNVSAAEITDFDDLMWGSPSGANTTVVKFNLGSGSIFATPERKCLAEILMVNPSHDEVKKMQETHPNKKLLIILTE